MGLRAEHSGSGFRVPGAWVSFGSRFRALAHGFFEAGAAGSRSGLEGLRIRPSAWLEVEVGLRGFGLGAGLSVGGAEED